jgi:hypothetical protein
MNTSLNMGECFFDLLEAIEVGLGELPVEQFDQSNLRIIEVAGGISLGIKGSVGELTPLRVKILFDSNVDEGATVLYKRPVEYLRYLCPAILIEWIDEEPEMPGNLLPLASSVPIHPSYMEGFEEESLSEEESLEVSGLPIYPEGFLFEPGDFNFESVITYEDKLPDSQKPPQKKLNKRQRAALRWKKETAQEGSTRPSFAQGKEKK